jgi:hypothetical protein
MTEGQNSKRYDLEDRTFEFVKRVRTFIKRLPKAIHIDEDVRQLVKSSGSVGSQKVVIPEKAGIQCFYDVLDAGSGPA